MFVVRSVFGPVGHRARDVVVAPALVHAPVTGWRVFLALVPEAEDQEEGQDQGGNAEADADFGAG